MHAREDQGITITLSPAQVEQVVRAAAGRALPDVASLLDTNASRGGRRGGSARVEGRTPAPSATETLLDSDDPRLSRSLLRGLAMLTRFNADGSERGIVELARELDISASTAHRYAQTLVRLGLLERCPSTRKYRLAPR